jgi:hypothetical protein
MLCASAVDAMLKDKGLKDGTLDHRINRAASDLALALDAFLARLHGEGLESGEDGAVVWLECSGCKAVILVPK